MRGQNRAIKIKGVLPKRRRRMEYHLQAPLKPADAKLLRAGDYVYLSGVIYSARDAAHKRLCEALAAGQPLPLDLKTP